MYMKQINHQRSFEHLNYNLIKSQNHLRIRKVKKINEKVKEQLILLVDTDEIIDNQVNAFIKGNILILEAPYQLYDSKPLRTHLLDREKDGDLEEEVSVIGFSQIQLKKGFHYEVQSCQLINPGLVKVILRYKRSMLNFNQTGQANNKT